MINTVHNLNYSVGFAPQVATNDTAIATGIIDMQGATEAEFLITTGTLADADATFAVTLIHGDDSTLAVNAAVPAAELVGSTTAASFNYADDNAVKKIGYVGTKRYVKLTVTPTSNGGNAPVACTVVKKLRHG